MNAALATDHLVYTLASQCWKLATWLPCHLCAGTT